jgi:hypothetical protein
MKYFYLFLWVCLAVIPFEVSGQNPLGAPLVVNYGKAVFQGGSRTWDIQQDSRGIMYFGNNEGLITFDGKYWKQYQLPNQTIVRSIYISPDDKVFVGGQGEFGYFEKSDKSDLRYVSLQKKIPTAYRQFADVWHTVGFEQGVFFMASNLLFAYKADKITVYPASSEWEFLGQVAGKLFGQDNANGLLEFNNSQWNVVAEAPPFAGSKISGMLEMGKDSVLVSMLNNRTFVLHHKKLTALNSTAWRNMYTRSVAKIDNNRYVVATATEGCHIRNKSGQLLERVA